MPLLFGKKPARHNAIKFKFRSFVKDDVPLPTAFGHVTNTIQWGVLGNDVAGCCVVSGHAHNIMLWSRASGRGITDFTPQNILNEYCEASGWNHIENDPSDTGLDMQKYAERVRRVGIPDRHGVYHKIKAYAAVKGIDEMLQATYLFGVCGVGLALPRSAQNQFMNGHPWDDLADKPEYGHYVPCVGRNSKGNLMFITWGQLQAATPAYVERYMDEAVCYLSKDYIADQGLSPEHLDEAKLDADLAELSA